MQRLRASTAARLALRTSCVVQDEDLYGGYDEASNPLSVCHVLCTVLSLLFIFQARVLHVSWKGSTSGGITAACESL